MCSNLKTIIYFRKKSILIKKKIVKLNFFFLKLNIILLYSLARLLVCCYVLGMLAIGEVKNESTGKKQIKTTTKKKTITKDVLKREKMFIKILWTSKEILWISKKLSPSVLNFDHILFCLNTFTCTSRILWPLAHLHVLLPCALLATL